VKYADLKADLAVAQARIAELQSKYDEVVGWNKHQARLIDEARRERDTSNDLLGQVLDQLDRDLGTVREGRLSDLRRLGREHVGD
jgi:hypothetical protein